MPSARISECLRESLHYQLLKEKEKNHCCSELFKCMRDLKLCSAALSNPLYHIAADWTRWQNPTVERDVILASIAPIGIIASNLGSQKQNKNEIYIYSRTCREAYFNERMSTSNSPCEVSADSSHGPAALILGDRLP